MAASAAYASSRRRYFISRLTDAPVTKGQLVSRAEVVEMIRSITAAKPEAAKPEADWEPTWPALL